MHQSFFYSRVSGRRIGAAILVTPFLLFSKGRKHYMTVSFDDGGKQKGAIEFKLHKSNYRGVLRTVEQITDLTMKVDDEGPCCMNQTWLATRSCTSGLRTRMEPPGPSRSRTADAARVAIPLLIVFAAPSSLVVERARPSQFPILRNGPPGTFVLFPGRLRVSLPTDQVVSADDTGGYAKVGFGGMRFTGMASGRLVFVRERDLYPVDQLSPDRSHTMRLEPQWVASVFAYGQLLWPAVPREP